MREKLIEKAGIWLVRGLGGWSQKLQSGSAEKAYKSKKTGVTRTHKIKMGDRGSPDTVNCMKGRFVGIEYKANEAEWRAWWRDYERIERGESPVDHRVEGQRMQKKMIEEAGGIYIVTYSNDHLESQLKEHNLI